MTTNQDSPNTAGAAEPVAWIYTSPHGDKELILNYGCEYAKRLRKSRWTETPLYTHPPENPPQRSSVVPDEVVEAVRLLIGAIDQDCSNDALWFVDDPDAGLIVENARKAWKALTASLPAIRAQAVAEEMARIVAWLRHDLDDWPDYVAPSDLADAIEQGSHDNTN